MTAGHKITAMIPARMGSTRLLRKNLALLNGKPLVYYAIEAAKQSGVFDKIVLNSENEAFAAIAKQYGVDFYRRPKELGESSVKSDLVVYDFMRNNPGEITAWVNSTSPLQTGDEVKNVVRFFCDDDLDSLITVREEQVHCLYNWRPLNFKEEEVFAQTQGLVPVQRFIYSVMMWRNKTFQQAYEKQGFALLCGKTGYYPVSKESSLIVKTEEDLRLVEYIMAGREIRRNYRLDYEAPGG